jgi:hypothetical protein
VIPDKAAIVPYVLVNAGVLAGLWRLGHVESVKDAVLTIGISLAVSGLIVPAWIFGLNWIRAPFAVALKRGQGEAYTLMAELLDTATELSLRNLPDGVSLTELMNPASEKANWLADVTRFRERARSELRPRVLPHEWAAMFGQMVVPPKHIRHAIDQEHNDHLLTLEQQIIAIRTVMADYAVKWSA